MKIKIWKYYIKEEEFCYSVWNWELEKITKSWDAWARPWIIYPRSLEVALLRVRDRMRIDKTWSVDLSWYIERIKKIDEDFFQWVKLVLKDLENYSKLEEPKI